MADPFQEGHICQGVSSIPDEMACPHQIRPGRHRESRPEQCSIWVRVEVYAAYVEMDFAEESGKQIFEFV